MYIICLSLLFVFVSIGFIFLVMLQQGLGMGINFSSTSSNISNLLKVGLYKGNIIVRLTSFFALFFIILNLILCITIIDKRNKSIILEKNNTFIPYSSNASISNILLDKTIDIPK